MSKRNVYIHFIFITFILSISVFLSTGFEGEASLPKKEIFIDTTTVSQKIDFFRKEITFSLELTPREPISIVSDDNFTDYGFPGSGNESDPYIIENYNITTTNGTGIYITMTTKYFLIRNCYVDSDMIGIWIWGAGDGTTSIINNTCINNLYGIYLIASNNSTLANNTCTNAERGICLDDSPFSTLTNNTCLNNIDFGIILLSAHGCTLSNNICINNNQGILLEDCSSLTLINNTCNLNNIGLRVWIFAQSIYLINNTCNNNTDSGIVVEDANQIYITDNFCYNNSIGILLANGVITSILRNNTCSNNIFHGISIDISTGSTLTANTCENNGHDGIVLSDSAISTLTDNNCNQNDVGIYIGGSTDSIVTDNTCNNNIYSGIYLDSSSSILIDNICNNNEEGISLVSSEESSLTRNTCNNNENGVSLSGSGFSTLLDNSCNNNHVFGILLITSYVSNLTDNTCNKNYFGISLSAFSDYCILTFNHLQENEQYGIYIEDSCSDNIIHHNDFIDNNLGGSSQAFEAGKRNIWYDLETNEGNSWTDLGDECTYAIDGDANSKDIYPLNRALSCPNPNTITIISIVIPIVACSAILAFIVPKYIVPYTKKTLIPQFRKRKTDRLLQKPKPKILFCSDCGSSIKTSLAFCENCGKTLPKREI